MLLDEASQKYITINIHKRLYQYTRLPFEITSAPAVFQRMMDAILQGVEGVACYIDDIIITGKTPAEHLEHLEEVLTRILHHGVHVEQSRCRLLQSSVCFLGHLYRCRRNPPTSRQVKSYYSGFNTSKCSGTTCSFLGLIN